MTAIETGEVLRKKAAAQAATTEIRVQQVLLDEAAAVHDPKALAKATLSATMTARQLNIGLNQLNSAALCLSGGGIRSAAFSLGVIQALASFPEPAPGQPPDHNGANQAKGSFLAQFHYLSTVSGGGYIGSWLSTWLKRETFSTVWQQLVKRPEAPDREPTPLSWLRRYSNYLTPKLGIVSADAWADIAIALRNMILNWLVLLPILCIAVLLLKFAEITVIWLAQFPKTGRLALPLGIEAEVGTLFAALGVLGALLLIAAFCFATLNRPTRGNSVSTQTTFLRWDWIPAILAAFLLSLWPISSWASNALAAVPLYVLALAGAGIGTVILAIAWLSAYMASAFITRRGTWRKPAGDFLLWIVAGLVYGALMACGAHLYFALSDPKSALFLSASSLLFDVVKNPAILLLMFGVPWALSAQLIAEMVFVGLSSYEAHSDSDREWLGRSGGWFMAAVIGWFLVMFLVLVGSELLEGLAGQAKNWIVSGGISGLVTALVGKSSLSPAKPGDAKTLPEISMNVILAISGPVFAISLVIVTSALLDKVLLGASLLNADFAAPRVVLDGHFPDVPSQYGWLALGLGIAIAVELIASFTVNINRFSLHSLYRNRLIRAFLGATNPTREQTRNPFTDFDTSDNPHMHELWPNKDNTRRLFHVVNIALNIVSTKDLAWQERKAESFIVSPLHAGNARLGFRPSAQYGHRDKGISVGTAAAISGAAASPNMGYHSSPSITFLLALFNVRLGWWLGNPGPNGEKTYPNEGPGVAVMPLLMEAFGLTTDDRSYVYLSDGGHFENLGLYEMVRRRCKFIVLVDAGCDPDFAYEDLGNAVRKIEIDQGVRIDFPDLHLLRSRPKDGTMIGLDKPYHTIGKIHYPAADEGGEPGKILYLKPAYHGVEGAGVQSYATAHPAFPHESTADQWFSESQFESYRSLAFEVTSDLLKAQIAKMAAPAKVTIADLFAAL